MITLTEAAKNKIVGIVESEANPLLAVRVCVAGGGCSGFQYQFTLDEEQNEDDLVVDIGTHRLLVDSISLQYLTGAEIDYIESITSSQFVIKNPLASATCGCGSSFAI